MRDMLKHLNKHLSCIEKALLDSGLFLHSVRMDNDNKAIVLNNLYHNLNINRMINETISKCQEDRADSVLIPFDYVIPTSYIFNGEATALPANSKFLYHMMYVDRASKKSILNVRLRNG